MQPLVSIIVPTCRGMEHICMSVEGALKQTYQPIEVIVVDDNGEGTEQQLKTEKILKQYIQSGQILYLKHEKKINGSAARNTGMKAAKGTYIAFLDDDDYFFPDKIEKQVRLFEALGSSYGLVFCSGYVVKPTGIGYQLDLVEDDILYHLLVGKLRFNSSMMMIRREVFERTGGFDEHCLRHQDWEFCCRVLSQYQGKALPEHLVVKYITDRNVPEAPEEAVRLRLYFLDQNKDIIAGLGVEKEKQILAFHYRDLALTYILAKQYSGVFRWLRKAGNPVIQFGKLCVYAYGRKTVHREKYAAELQ